MKLLIVGGAGDVGTHLIEDYSRQGHDMRILDLAPASAAMQANPRVTYIQGDLADKTTVQQVVEGIDLIIHLAWSFKEDPHTIFGTDILGTAHLLDAAVSAGVRSFIYASTAVAVSYTHLRAHETRHDLVCRLLLEKKKKKKKQ